MSKHFFAPTDTPIADTLISALTAGQAAIVAEGSAAALAAIPATGKFDLVWMKSDGTLVSETGLSKANIVSAKTIGYTGGTSQISKVTPVLPSVQEKGQAYTLRIVNTTPGTMNLPAKTFEVVHQGTDFTVATLIDAFVALIGSDNEIGVSASDQVTFLELTANNSDIHFAVATDNYLETSTVTLVTKNVPSFGIPSKIKALEAECFPYQYGIWNKLLHEKVPASEIGTGNYDVTVVEIEVPVRDKSGKGVKAIEQLKLYIAEPTGATVVGDLFTA